MEHGLYLVATPVGNLDDMTLRGVEVLKNVDVIGAEDTRHSRILTQHFGIETPLISYHEHNKITRGVELLERLKAGETVAVISDAGTPGISDPGADLAALCIKEGIPVHPVPGGNAVLSAVICSGLDCSRFVFFGFLPVKGRERREDLERLRKSEYTAVIYIPPHRLKEDLGDLAEVAGKRRAALCREMTKIHESFYYGTVDELCEEIKDIPIKGELALVLEGAGEAVGYDDSPCEEELKTELFSLTDKGVPSKVAIELVSEKYGIKKNSLKKLIMIKDND